MPKKIKQKLYICPSCNEKQTSAIEWQGEDLPIEMWDSIQEMLGW